MDASRVSQGWVENLKLKLEIRMSVYRGNFGLQLRWRIAFVLAKKQRSTGLVCFKTQYPLNRSEKERRPNPRRTLKIDNSKGPDYTTHRNAERVPS